MLRSLFFLFSLGTLLLIGAANVGAQQRPGTGHSTTQRKTAASRSPRARAVPASRTFSTKRTDTDTQTAADANGSVNTATNPKEPGVVNADGKGQGVYAAPGMPVNVASGSKTGSYDGPAKKTGATSKGGSTLKAGGN